MKVQLKEIVLAVPALSKLSARDLQLRLAYKLKRMITALQKEADFFAEQRQKIFEKYGTAKEDGSFDFSAERRTRAGAESVDRLLGHGVGVLLARGVVGAVAAGQADDHAGAGNRAAGFGETAHAAAECFGRAEQGVFVGAEVGRKRAGDALGAVEVAGMQLERVLGKRLAVEIGLRKSAGGGAIRIHDSPLFVRFVRFVIY